MRKESVNQPVASSLKRRLFLALILSSCAVGFLQTARADEISSSVWCRPNLASVRREELSIKLREITGWTHLRFDEHGALRLERGANDFANDGQGAHASHTARELVRAAATGERLIVLEDASRRADVVFSRVVEGRFTTQATSERVARPRVFIILIDFTDFEHVRGDRAARAAFNVGWAMLHEMAHVVYDLDDAEQSEHLGACEQLINRMRRECGLEAERAAYHFNYFPGARTSEFFTRFVRLAFERTIPQTNERKRVWLIWDAGLVGGLDSQTSGRVGRDARGVAQR